jgi:argininosuccinate lyase
MGKIWQGRTGGSLDGAADKFNSSVSFDSRLFREDIDGSIAHAEMLGRQKIIPAEDAVKIAEALKEMKADIESGALKIDLSAEDIHSFIESELTLRIGEAGKKLHTARSRNDQSATDLRLYLRSEASTVQKLLKSLAAAIVDKAEKNTDAIMPGYTHLQRAQPISFAHHLLAYFQMFKRDFERIGDALKRLNVSPLGSAALAGVAYPIDREYTAAALGFDSNSETASTPSRTGIT